MHLTLARLVTAAALLLVAASTPLMGFAAAEHWSGRRFFAVIEGDWLFVFALVAGAACVRVAIELAIDRR